MKKTLLFILVAALCVSLAAQPPTNKGVYHSQIGETYYFLETNHNARNTINWSPDGSTCAAVWTMGSAGSVSERVRGTGINYFDNIQQFWGKMPNIESPATFERIETGLNDWAPGWGAHAFTEQGECVVSHCTAAVDGKGAMLVNRRDKAGEGEWIQTVLQGPVLECGSTSILWPTMTAVGNTIHMFCLTEAKGAGGPPCGYIPTGIDMQPLYYRSLDGGKTWEEPKDFVGTIPAKEMENFTSDCYTITARGNHVVILYHITYGIQVAYLESMDGGDTWVRKLVYEVPFDLSTSDPAMGPGSSAVAIGDDGVVHIAFAGKIIGNIPENICFFRWSNMHSGLFVWNSKQDPLTSKDFGIKFDWGSLQFLSLDYREKPFFLYAPGILGKPDFEYSKDFDDRMFVENYDKLGIIGQPSLIAEEGRVYLSYSAIIQEPLLSISNQRFMRGVFLTVSHDNGETYNQFENTFWLSYSPDFFFANWTGFDPENPTANPPELILTTECGYPTMAPSIKNGKIALTWLHDLSQFPEWDDSPLDPWVNPAFSVHSFMITVEDILNEKWYMTKSLWNRGDYLGYPKVAEQTLENLKIYPNPATDNVLVVLEQNEPFTVMVTNMIGQKMQIVKGEGKVTFNVSDYPSGIYIVNVRTAQAASSQKLIVR